MRKISATYIIDGIENSIKDGILILDNSNKVLDLINPQTLYYQIDDIEKYNGIICPGFVNNHCHTELSFLKNKIEKKTGLNNFISALEIERKKFIAQDTIEESIHEADKFMQEQGIVAVADICNSLDSVNVKKRSSLLYHSFVEVFGSDIEKADSIFKISESKFKTLKNVSYNSSIIPHSMYSLSENLFKNILNWQRENNSITSIHFMESEDEVEFFMEHSGKIIERTRSYKIEPQQFSSVSGRPSEFVDNAVDKSLSSLFVHNTYISEIDIKNIQKTLTNAWFCLCPNANLYIENRFPNITLIEKYSEKITIGTDSLASNSRLSILEEIKTIQKHFPEITTPKLIRWATYNGAEFLGITNQFGSFAKGTLPGVNLIKCSDLDLRNAIGLEVLVNG